MILGFSSEGPGLETPPQHRRVLLPRPVGCLSSGLVVCPLRPVTWCHLFRGTSPCRPGTAQAECPLWVGCLGSGAEG